jgi:hypothetical protein
MDSHKELMPVRLNSNDANLILDALEASAVSYERTADWIACDERGETYDYGDEFFTIEDVSTEEKARYLAGRYREVMGLVDQQIEEWKARQVPS